jgi:hypothetical protein
MMMEAMVTTPMMRAVVRGMVMMNGAADDDDGPATWAGDLGSAATSKFKGRSVLRRACPACRIHARRTPSDCIESGGFVFGR